MYAAAAQADAAPAQETWPQVWINPGIYSQHFDTSKGLRNNNIGFGAEVMLARDHLLMAGSFINSNRARTHFAGYEWRPLHWQFSGFEVSAGIAVGAFDGYPNYRNGGWFVAPLPLLAIEGRRLGANISSHSHHRKPLRRRLGGSAKAARMVRSRPSPLYARGARRASSATGSSRQLHQLRCPALLVRLRAFGVQF